LGTARNVRAFWGRPFCLTFPLLQKGTLHPDTLIVAVESFTKQKVDQGLLFYEQNRKLGRIFFDFKDLSPGITYVTPEDSVMLKRELSGLLIHFTFGRNLYWYHWDKQHQPSTAPVSQPSTTNPIGSFKLKEKEDIHERLATNAKRQQTTQRRTRPARDSPKKMITAPVPPPLPGSDAMLVDSTGAPIPPPPPPPGGLKRKREDGDIPPPPPGMCTPILLQETDSHFLISQILLSLVSPMGGSATKKRKLRQLNWSAIPRSKIESTFWRDAGSPSKSNGFQIDETEIEDLFSLSPKST
jgi:hypothetical protein